jgi:hypothetical protein
LKPEGDHGVDLRNYITVDDIEARYATIDELLAAAEAAAGDDIGPRLMMAARYREALEVRDQEIVGELIGRLEADPLDHVTIVLEMTTQQAVEEELKIGRLFSSCRLEGNGESEGTDSEEG